MSHERPTIRGAFADPDRPDLQWPAQAAALATILVYLALPNKLTPGPSWLLPALEGALLVGLVLSAPSRRFHRSGGHRRLALVLLALVTAANLFSLIMLTHFLLEGGRAGGHRLILSGIELWSTNVLIFGIWYWEVDRGGPLARHRGDDVPIDFLFPQMMNPDVAPRDWTPGFVDYLYVAFTNASAFSPTDAMPLTPRVKLLMTVQALISLITVALIVSRAVNILS